MTREKPLFLAEAFNANKSYYPKRLDSDLMSFKKHKLKINKETIQRLRLFFIFFFNTTRLSFEIFMISHLKHYNISFFPRETKE